LLTICDERTNLFKDAKKLLDDFCENRIKIFDTHIPSTVKIGEANYSSKSIIDYDNKSKAELAYFNSNQSAKEIQDIVEKALERYFEDN